MSLKKGSLSRGQSMQGPGTPGQQKAPRPYSAKASTLQALSAIQPDPEQRLREAIEYNNRARLSAMAAIQRNREIIRQSQQTIDKIQSRISAKQGQNSANDLSALTLEQNRLRLWKTQNAKKIAGCRRLIGLMDVAEQELINLRPSTEEHNRSGFTAVQMVSLFCTIPTVQRLAVGALAEPILNKPPVRLSTNRSRS